MNSFDSCLVLLREDLVWRDFVLAGPLCGDESLLPSFWEVLALRLRGMEGQGHWAAAGPTELAAWLRANVKRHFHRHPLVEPYGMGPLRMEKPKGGDGASRWKVHVRSRTGESCLGGRLDVELVRAGSGELFVEGKAIFVDVDDQASRVSLDLPLLPAGQEIDVRFLGYDFCWSTGTRLEASTRRARFTLLP